MNSMKMYGYKNTVTKVVGRDFNSPNNTVLSVTYISIWCLILNVFTVTKQHTMYNADRVIDYKVTIIQIYFAC